MRCAEKKIRAGRGGGNFARTQSTAMDRFQSKPIICGGAAAPARVARWCPSGSASPASRLIVGSGGRGQSSLTVFSLNRAVATDPSSKLEPLTPVRGCRTAVKGEPTDIQFLTDDAFAVGLSSGELLVCKLPRETKSAAAGVKTLKSLPLHTGSVTCVQPLSGHTVVSACDDGLVRVTDLNAQTEKAAFRLQWDTRCAVYCATPGADGIFYTGGMGGRIVRWDLREKRPTPPRASLRPANAILAIKAGDWDYQDAAVAKGRSKTLATGSDDGTVCLWDVRKMSDPLVQTRGAHKGAVWAVETLPRSYAVLSAGADGQVRISDFETFSGEVLSRGGKAEGKVAAAPLRLHSTTINSLDMDRKADSAGSRWVVGAAEGGSLTFFQCGRTQRATRSGADDMALA